VEIEKATAALVAALVAAIIGEEMSISYVGIG